jgi:type IV secretory pathway VirD2 relaxase
MPFDLYGNSYASEREAMNAEYAQMAEIDASIALRDLRELELQMPDPFYEQQWRESIEHRISALESFAPISLCQGDCK